MRKNKKKQWLKHPKVVPRKRNLDQSINDSKSSVWIFFLFENIISGIQLFYIRSNIHVVIRFFFISDFLAESLKANKTSKKITCLTIQFRSKNLTHFANFDSLDVENNMLPQYSQKTFWLKNFPAKIFLFGVRKNICTAPFLDAWELHSSRLDALWKQMSYISVYLLKRYFDPET